MIYFKLKESLVEQVSLLVYYLPYCTEEKQKDSITYEIYRLRKRIVEIEDMTKSEKETPIKMIRLEIESLHI